MSIIEFQQNALSVLPSASRALTDPVERLCDPVSPALRGSGLYAAVGALWDFHDDFEDDKEGSLFTHLSRTLKRNIYLYSKYRDDFDLQEHTQNALAAWLVLTHYVAAPNADSWALLKPATRDLLDGYLTADNRNPPPIMADLHNPAQRDDPFHAALAMMVGLRNEILFRSDAQLLRRHGYGAPFTAETMDRLTLRHHHAMRALADNTPMESRLALANQQYAHDYITAYRTMIPARLRGPQLVRVI